MGGCAALNCTTRSERKEVRIFRFPLNPTRRKQWAHYCRRGAEWEPTDHSRLCELHFEDNQFEINREDKWRKLKWNAVPTIFDVPNPPPRIVPLPRKSVYKNPQPLPKDGKDQVSRSPLKEIQLPVDANKLAAELAPENMEVRFKSLTEKIEILTRENTGN